MASRSRSNGPRAVPGALLKGLLALLILGGALLAGHLVLRSYLEVEQFAMPAVVGMPLEDAHRLLRRYDLQVLSYAENVSGARVDSVTTQSPAAEVLVRRGRSVSIGVHSPPEDMRVPSFVGETEEVAARRLREVGLELGEVSYRYSDQPQGRVLEQQPASGTILRTGSSVSLEVSRGAEIRELAVPDVTGLPVAAAQQRLQAAGFRRVDAVAAGTSFSQSGVVTQQFPEAGQSVVASSAITVYYNLSSQEVVRVPALDGMTLQRAQLFLRAAGLDVGWVDFVENPERPEGVVAYRPSGFTLPGTPIVLEVNGRSGGENTLLPPVVQDGATSTVPGGTDAVRPGAMDGVPGPAATPGPGAPAGGDGPPDGARRLAFRFDPAAQGLPVDQTYAFRLVVRDERGERVLIEESLRPRETVDTQIDIYDGATLQIFINDILYLAWSP